MQRPCSAPFHFLQRRGSEGRSGGARAAGRVGWIAVPDMGENPLPPSHGTPLVDAIDPAEFVVTEGVEATEDWRLVALDLRAARAETQQGGIVQPVMANQVDLTLDVNELDLERRMQTRLGRQVEGQVERGKCRAGQRQGGGRRAADRGGADTGFVRAWCAGAGDNRRGDEGMSEELAEYGAKNRAEGAEGEEKTALRPCPFCGETPTMQSGMDECWVSCGCGSAGPRAAAEIDAARDWNRRARLGGDASPYPNLVTTIRWHRPAERMPAYGVTVVVWMEALKLTARAHRDAVSGSDDSWRICGRLTSGELITAWTDAPNGPLPAPDNGGEE